MKLSRISLLLLLAVGLFLGWRYLPALSGKKTDAAKESKEDKSVPVTAVEVAKQDVPIWLTGLGTVQAYNKVTIRPRVSGALDEINFTEGQQVKEGDVLARIDPRPYESLLAQANAKVEQSAAQLLNARQNVARVEKLVSSGAESRQIYEQLEATVAQLAAQELADKAAVEAAQLNLDFTTIKAPISGRTGIRLIDKGNLVTASQEGGLVVISQFQPVSVVFTLPQDNLPAIRKRMLLRDAFITVQAMNDDGQILSEGKLDLIDNEISTDSGTLKLKATFPNDDQALWPGQFLTARVLVDTRNQVAVVPTQVITSGIDGPFAYVVKTDKTVEPRNVKLGPRVEGITVIEEGLSAGEQTVLDGQSKLQPGARVSIQPAKL